jgi:4-hydroxy-tetrahydrodipicolinate synthase
MLKGSFTALVTPFLEDGSVDYAAFKKMVAFQVEKEVDGIVVAGSTGESSTLSSLEKKELIATAVKEAGGKVLVIAGTGCNNTRSTLEKTTQAKELGADACLVILPYYNKPTFEGCLAHFEQVAKVGLPMIVYHHPGRTGLYLKPEELVELCGLQGVIGLKEAYDDLEHSFKFMELSSKPLLSGNDDLTLDLIAKGASGSISIIGNLVPQKWKECVHEALLGNRQKARELYCDLEPVCQSLVLETNPQCIKYAMSLKGACAPFMRLPLLLPRQETRKALEEACFEL